MDKKRDATVEGFADDVDGELAKKTSQEQDALYEVLKATDPHLYNGNTLYDTWASALWEAGVRA